MTESDTLANEILVLLDDALRTRSPGPFTLHESMFFEEYVGVLHGAGALDAADHACTRLMAAVGAEVRTTASDAVFNLLLRRAEVRAELGRFAEADDDLAAAGERAGVFTAPLWFWGPFKMSHKSVVGGRDLEFAHERIGEYRSGKRHAVQPDLKRLRRMAADLDDRRQLNRQRWRWSLSDAGSAGDDEITKWVWRFLEDPVALGPLYLSSPCNHAIILSAGRKRVVHRIRPWEDGYRKLSEAEEDAESERRGHAGLGSEALDLLAWEEAHLPVGEPCWRDRPIQLIESGWLPSAYPILGRLWLARSFPRPVEVEAVDQVITAAFAALGLPRSVVRPAWCWDRDDWEACRPRRLADGTGETGPKSSAYVDAGALPTGRTHATKIGAPVSLSTGEALSRGVAVPRRSDLNVARRDSIADVLRQVIADPVRYKFAVFVATGHKEASVQFATREWSDAQDASVLGEVVGVQTLPEADRAALWVRGWGDQTSRGEGWWNWGWAFPPPVDPLRLADEAEWVFAHIWRIGDAPLTAETSEGLCGESSTIETRS